MGPAYSRINASVSASRIMPRASATLGASSPATRVAVSAKRDNGVLRREEGFAVSLARIGMMDVIVLARLCCAKTLFYFASRGGYVGTPLMAPVIAKFTLLEA